MSTKAKGSESTEATWEGVIVPEAAPQAQGLLGRSELRLDVRRALEAIGKTLSAVVAGATLGSASPALAIGKVALDALLAVAALRSAVLWSLTPAEFLVCVILSTEKEGRTLGDVESNVSFYLGLDEQMISLLPWYLRIDRAFLEEARVHLEETNGIENILSKQEKEGRIILQNGRYRYNDQFVTLKMS